MLSYELTSALIAAHTRELRAAADRSRVLAAVPRSRSGGLRPTLSRAVATAGEALGRMRTTVEPTRGCCAGA
jgi:hypothetical protein